MAGICRSLVLKPGKLLTALRWKLLTVGVNLKSGYNGDLTAREAGSIGEDGLKRWLRPTKTA